MSHPCSFLYVRLTHLPALFIYTWPLHLANMTGHLHRPKSNRAGQRHQTEKHRSWIWTSEEAHEAWRTSERTARSSAALWSSGRTPRVHRDDAQNPKRAQRHKSGAGTLEMVRPGDLRPLRLNIPPHRKVNVNPREKHSATLVMPGQRRRPNVERRNSTVYKRTNRFRLDF